MREVEGARKKISWLLGAYTLVTTLLAVSGINVEPLIIRMNQVRNEFILAYFYLSLPFLMWIYHVCTLHSARLLRVYAVFEILKYLFAALFIWTTLPFGAPLWLPGSISLGSLCLCFLLFQVRKAATTILNLPNLPEATATERRRTFIFGFLMLLCYISPFVKIDLAKQFKGYGLTEVKEIYRVNSEIKKMTISPDGRLLAVAAAKGFYLWDIQSRDFVFSDDKISAQRVRFSDEGNYCAVAGNGMPLESGDRIVVYETEGFCQISEIGIPIENEYKTRDFYDIRFRPDENKFLVIWKEEWGQKYRRAPVKEQEKARKEEDLKFGGRTPSMLFCREYESRTGSEIQSRILKEDGGRGNFVDGTAFLPGASELIFYRQLEDGIVFANTSDWSEIVDFSLESVYRDLSLLFGGNNFYRPFSSNRDGRRIYFMPQSSYICGVVTLDRDTGVLKDAYVQYGELGKKSMSNAWRTLELSPDEKHIALLGWEEAYMNYGYNVLTVRVVDIEKGDSRLVVRKFKHTKDHEMQSEYSGYAVQLAWTDDSTVAVSVNGWAGEFMLVDVMEEAN